ncbi:hypothetical protein K3G63_10955 [Hymenobacter sp. HSC-4F20]|uniref:hypothetical protein n=1 Tax=Hymenobacter sp. HSC-4F20 TaxID=2864135 RepID=UPI001C736A8D|nr:hypothetical protein [Hymenobacter sp. HSC-4F20]MBX0290961.1 hypothetical protein [Hymenobacter sp. HSC-4F20]
MKQLLYFSLAAVLLSACDTGPKFKNPVTIKGNSVPLYNGQQVHDKDMPSKVVVLADQGDTLELQDIMPTNADGETLCIVALDSKRTRFKNGQASAYIERKYLDIPSATLAKAEAGKLHDLPAPSAEKPEHLNQKR